MTNRPTDRQTPASYSSDYTRLKSTGANGSKRANKYGIQTKCKFDKMQADKMQKKRQNANLTKCKTDILQI